MLIDSHAHPYFKDFDRDREAMLDRAFEQDISMVAIGTDSRTNKLALKLAQEYPGKIYSTAGLHPNDINSGEDFDIHDYKSLLAYDEVVGVGEVGLDYFRLKGSNEEKKATVRLQKSIFAEFVDLAKEANLPLVIHTRSTDAEPFKALADVIDILTSKNYFNGVVHCYAGNVEQAQFLSNKGMYLGITGIVTFKNADLLREVVMETDLKSLVVETDCPYLTPEPHRGERNEPSYVSFVAQKIAELKGLPFETVAQQTVENTKKLYRL